MCRAAGVSRAGFYRDWQKRQPQAAEVAIRDAVQKAAPRHRRYGYRRVLQMVQRSGMAVGEWVVRRILRTDNLLSVRKRKFVATTDSQHCFAVYPNLAQYVQLKAINQLWVADITYVRLGARVRLFGGGAGCLFAARDRLVARPQFANQPAVERVKPGDC